MRDSSHKLASPPQPSRRQWLQLSMGAGAACLAGSVAAAPGLVWRERRLQGLGTDLALRAGHAQGAQTEAGLDAAVAAIRHVEQQFSLFDPHSSLSRLNREGVLHQPHPDFVHLLKLAKQLSARSQGSFDITVQALWQAWQHAKQSGRLPTAVELAAARAHVGSQWLEVSTDKVRFLKPGMAATLNGIAQGFAGDLASAALRAHGIQHALLNTGEWNALGHSPEDTAWRLGVADPRDEARLLATLSLASLEGTRAVATSSDTQYRFGADDRHHHIFNPKTGYSPRGLASVTVVAGNCTLADALTKVMFMADLKGALRLAATWKVDVLAVDKAGRFAASPGLAAKMGHS
jgi:FAD:protein FMN transferase